jgi:hypothetical protein
MSFDFVRRCLLPDLPVKGLPHVVLLILASNANAEGECWRSVPRMALEARCTDRRVQSSLRALQAKGLIAIRRGGPHGCNVYRLTLPPVDTGDAYVTPGPRRPRGASGFHVEPRGDASVTGGDGSVTQTPASPVTLAVAGGDAGGIHGATPMSPEAGKPQEADAVETATAADREPVVILEDDPDADAEQRVAAVARRGGFLTMRGADIRGEWVAATRGHTPAQVEANLVRWSVTLPTAYTSRKVAEQREAAARAAQAQRAAREVEAQRQREAESREKTEQGAQLRARVDRLAKRLRAWLRDDPEGREVGAVIAENERLRLNLDLMTSGREGAFWGQQRLVIGLSGRPRALLDRFIAATTADLTTETAAISG